MEFIICISITDAIDKSIEELERDIEKYKDAPANSINGRICSVSKETLVHLLAAKKSYHQPF